MEKALHDDLEGKVFSEAVIDRSKKSLVDGRLPCPSAHGLSRQLKVPLKEIGDAATKMKIRISFCQLGCFT
ncbi:MAG: hypothetical protein A2Z15_01870 [Chloroflexi bacterium RBG_16_50_11]|nr:MAG: hypothetical protein A2Z15_01870 [Chloroflexi bacterium RBG_16_50_11]